MKKPHAAGARWINAKFIGNGTLLRSHELDQPLAPGLGAVRFTMLPEVLADGAVVGYDGTGGAHCKLFLPEHLYARNGRYFVRHAVRFRKPPEIDPPGGYQVYQSPAGQPVFTNSMGGAGKMGLMPSHETPDGGVSGSSGDGHGYQLRLLWRDVDYLGPDAGGIQIGLHLHDFQRNANPGHKYGSGDPVKGGKAVRLFGTTIWYDEWNEIEAEFLPNSLLTASPGYVPDGILRLWLNGRLIYDISEFVVRSLPLDPRPYNPNSMRPIRELGVNAFWLNWFHGGTVANAKTRIMDICAIAWGTEYHGPMRKG